MVYQPLQDNPENDPLSLIGKIGDVFLRGQYASTAFMETLLSQGGNALGAAVLNSGKEFFNPGARLSYKDLIKKHAPRFAVENPTSTAVMGFIGDIAMDPLTWTTFGTGTVGAKVVVGGVRKTLSKKAGDAAVKHAFGPKLTAKGQQRFKQLYRQNRRGVDNAVDAYALTMSQIKNSMNKAVNPPHAANQLWQLTDKVAAAETFGDDIGRVLSSPLMKNAFMKEHGLKEADLYAESAIRFMGNKIPGTERMMKAMGKTASDLFAPLRETRFVSFISKAFNRNVGIHPELQEVIRKQYAEVAEGQSKVEVYLKSLAETEGITQGSMEAIGAWGLYFQDLGTKLYKQAELVAGSPGKDKSVAAKKAWDRVSNLINGNVPFARILETKGGRKFQKMMKKHGQGDALRPLNPEERHALSTMMGHMKELGELEKSSALISKMRGVYWPGYYKEIRQAGKLVDFKRATKSVGAGQVLDASHAKKFKTLSAAYAAGYEPTLDAATIFAQRTLASQRAVASARMNERIIALYPELVGKLSPKAKKQALKGLAKHNPKLAEELGTGSKKAIAKYMKKHPGKKKLGEATDLQLVMEHIQKMGDGFYSKQTSEEVNELLRATDTVTRWFKTSATVVRPSFGVRQIVSNSFQMFLKSGIKAFGGPGRFGFDPTSTLDAALLMAGKTDFHITTPQGLKYTGGELQDLITKFHIKRNVTVDGEIGRGTITGKRGAEKFMKELFRDKRTREMLQKGGIEGEGLTKIMRGAMNYTHFPSFVEDSSRTVMFVNMLRNGHDPATAAQLVEKGLFDYAHGLSQFEEQWMKRIIPFYSYQRMGSELIAATAITNPGRIGNAEKVMKGLAGAFNKVDNVMNGRTESPLTESERRVMPGWLLEQPQKFAGWSKEMRAVFHTFNNFTPLDVMGFVSAKEGSPDEIDVAQTVRAGVLSQLAPIAKIPLELAMEKDFFTGRSFENARNIGHMDEDHLAATVTAAILGSLSASSGISKPGLVAPGAVAGMEVLSRLAPMAAKDTVKRWLGMEQGVNSKGEATTYFSPYAWHILSSIFPAVNDMTKLGRMDKQPLEKTMHFLGGIPTVSLNMEEEKSRRAKQSQYDLKDKQYQVRKALAQERHVAAVNAHVDLQKFVLELQDDYKYLNQPVRGPLDGL
jgi:hypothetical protein